MNVNLLGLLAILIFACLSGCAPQKSNLERELASRSALLGDGPFLRGKVINVYGLHGLKSSIMNGGIRSNSMLFVEMWEISNGYKIYGVNSKFVGPIAINSKELERIDGTKQKKFKRVYIINNSGALVYDTTWSLPR